MDYSLHFSESLSLCQPVDSIVFADVQSLPLLRPYRKPYSAALNKRHDILKLILQITFCLDFPNINMNGVTKTFVMNRTQ